MRCCGTHRYHQLSGTFSQVFSRHKSDLAVSVGYLHLVVLGPVLIRKIVPEALAVGTLTYDSIGNPALLQIRLRVEVGLHDHGLAVTRPSKRGIVDVFDAHTPRSVYRSDVALETELVVNGWA